MWEVSLRRLLILTSSILSCGYQGTDCKLRHGSDCKVSGEVTRFVVSPQPWPYEMDGNAWDVSCSFGEDPFDPGPGFTLTILFEMPSGEPVDRCKRNHPDLVAICDTIVIKVSFVSYYWENRTEQVFSENGRVTVGFLWLDAEPSSSTPLKHFRLDKGSVTFTHLSDRMNRVEFVLRYVPDPRFEAELRDYDLWRDSIEVAGWCVCEPYRTGTFCVEE